MKINSFYYLGLRKAYSATVHSQVPQNGNDGPDMACAGNGNDQAQNTRANAHISDVCLYGRCHFMVWLRLSGPFVTLRCAPSATQATTRLLYSLLFS